MSNTKKITLKSVYEEVFTFLNDNGIVVENLSVCATISLENGELKTDYFVHLAFHDGRYESAMSNKAEFLIPNLAAKICPELENVIVVEEII